MYLSFTGSILQQEQRHNDAIGGEKLHPDDTMLMAPFLQEWDPSVPSSTPRDQNVSKFS